jgi:hypothetical protein
MVSVEVSEMESNGEDGGESTWQRQGMAAKFEIAMNTPKPPKKNSQLAVFLQVVVAFLRPIRCFYKGLSSTNTHTHMERSRDRNDGFHSFIRVDTIG